MRDGAGWVGRPVKYFIFGATLNPGTDETNNPPRLNYMLVFSL